MEKYTIIYTKPVGYHGHTVAMKQISVSGPLTREILAKFRIDDSAVTHCFVGHPRLHFLDNATD